MLIKKLLAPLVNDKILHEAERCYFATHAISEPAYDFIMERLNKKCPVDIVTGLDGPTSPLVLKKILHFNEKRVILNIHPSNTFHANVFIFDMPFRKSIAFIGSGSLSLNGLKDFEEVFYKVTNEKEIEKIKSWFNGYFEFGIPLNEKIVAAYEPLYDAMIERDKINWDAMLAFKDSILRQSTSMPQWHQGTK